MGGLPLRRAAAAGKGGENTLSKASSLGKVLECCTSTMISLDSWIAKHLVIFGGGGRGEITVGYTSVDTTLQSSYLLQGNYQGFASLFQFWFIK